VLSENAQICAVHILKDNQRIEVTIIEEAIQAAASNAEWAVKRIIAGDFPKLETRAIITIVANSIYLTVELRGRPLVPLKRYGRPNSYLIRAPVE
jgi:hypothetical protein